MSRTDKDACWHIRAKWYRPSHQFCQFDIGRRSWHRPPDLKGRTRECDLPPSPRRGANHPSNFRGNWKRREYACTWEPEYPHRDRYRYTRPPNRGDRHLDWWGPDRALVREQVRESIKEFRGTGDIDTIVSTRHHRHCSIKGWWD